jgi:hypothetical protein
VFAETDDDVRGEVEALEDDLLVYEADDRVPSSAMTCLRDVADGHLRGRRG